MELHCYRTFTKINCVGPSRTLFYLLLITCKNYLHYDFSNDIESSPFCSDGIAGDPASQSVPVKWKDDEVDLTKTIPQEMPGQKRRRGLYQTFFTWYLDNSDPSVDDIAEVSRLFDIFPIPTPSFNTHDLFAVIYSLDPLSALDRTVNR